MKQRGFTIVELLVSLGVHGMFISPGYHYEKLDTDHFMFRKEIHEEIENSVNYYKMQSMNQSLIALLVNRRITYAKAMELSTDVARHTLPALLAADAAGVRTVAITQGERIEIRLPAGVQRG
mgnify:CR=1 FL=1